MLQCPRFAANVSSNTASSVTSRCVLGWTRAAQTWATVIHARVSLLIVSASNLGLTALNSGVLQATTGIAVAEYMSLPSSAVQ